MRTTRLLHYSLLAVLVLLTGLAGCKPPYEPVWDYNRADYLTNKTSETWRIQRILENGSPKVLTDADLSVRYTFNSNFSFTNSDGNGGNWGFDTDTTKLYLIYRSQYIQDSLRWNGILYIRGVTGVDTVGIDTFALANLSKYELKGTHTAVYQGSEVTYIPARLVQED